MKFLDVAKSCTPELIDALSAAKWRSLLMARYKIEGLGETPLETMEAIARKNSYPAGKTHRL